MDLVFMMCGVVGGGWWKKKLAGLATGQLDDFTA
jgi:hypothetical protein